MTPRALTALFALILAAPLRAGQIEAPVRGEFRPGGQTGTLGAGLGAPVPIQLSVPSLTGSLAPTLAANLTPAPLFVQPAIAPAAAVPVGAAAIAVAPVPALPASAVTAKNPAALAEGTRSAAFAPDAAPEAGLAEGAALFDQAKPTLWSALRERLPFGERAPSWPGKEGESVRIGAIKTVLDKPIGNGGTSKVWQSRDRNYAVKLLHPGASVLPGAREEAATLRAIAGSDLPVAKLIAESRDGRVLVKEFIEGATAGEILERGAFSRPQTEGWTEFAALLIKNGVTADLARGNLIWQHWRSRWVIVDAGGLRDSAPAGVLTQLLSPALLARAKVDPGAFLSGLRARLGPDSPAWARTAAALEATPELRALRASLEPFEARLEGAPILTFTPAAKAAEGLDDSVVSVKEVIKRLGVDPYSVKNRIKLHGEDPGKLNTAIYQFERPQKRSMIIKIAQWEIIRNEAAARRLARRFFGRYFRVPASLSVQNGFDSWMVMERADASSVYKNAFSLEQRVALALFARTFGISDMNPGNVLAAHDGGLPWLIDFEQAFGRSDPATGKHIPDERIAMEKPWMSRETRNHIEDYQPAIKAWRELLAKPATRAAMLSDLTASGFTPAEAAGLLARFDLNAADLDWTLQNDADFVNQFADRNAAQR